MTSATRRAALTAPPTPSTLAIPSALVAPAAATSLASISPELRAAIDAHRLAQANVDAQSSGQEEAFDALCDLEGEAQLETCRGPLLDGCRFHGEDRVPSSA